MEFGKIRDIDILIILFLNEKDVISLALTNKNLYTSCMNIFEEAAKRKYQGSLKFKPKEISFIKYYFTLEREVGDVIFPELNISRINDEDDKDQYDEEGFHKETGYTKYGLGLDYFRNHWKGLSEKNPNVGISKIYIVRYLMKLGVTFKSSDSFWMAGLGRLDLLKYFLKYKMIMISWISFKCALERNQKKVIKWMYDNKDTSLDELPKMRIYDHALHMNKYDVLEFLNKNIVKIGKYQCYNFSKCVSSEKYFSAYWMAKNTKNTIYISSLFKFPIPKFEKEVMDIIKIGAIKPEDYLKYAEEQKDKQKIEWIKEKYNL